MLGPGGFDAGRDVLAITVNRWSHGYSWGPNTLVDNWDEHESAGSEAPIVEMALPVIVIRPSTDE